jgi:hypothetical protein
MSDQWSANAKLAEGAGFEPARRFITVYTLSRRAPSTTRPSLQARLGHWRMPKNSLTKPPKACNGTRALRACLVSSLPWAAGKRGRVPPDLHLLA